MLDFPLWLRATHVLNILFLSLLARSGLEILSAHPKLYWNDDCTPGREWLRFTKKTMPRDKLWTGRDEEESFPSWLALPGHRCLGLGRHWHFASVTAWLATGAVYVVLLFTTGDWRRLVPTSWSVFANAWQALLDYLQFRIPADAGYNGLQQLSYFGVVFLLAPFMLATGAAMSPAIAAQFPRYSALFGGRQSARSLHFLSLAAFTAFTVVHTAMVLAHGLHEGDRLGNHWSRHRPIDSCLGHAFLAAIPTPHAASAWRRGRSHPTDALPRGHVASRLPALRDLAVFSRQRPPAGGPGL